MSRGLLEKYGFKSLFPSVMSLINSDSFQQCLLHWFFSSPGSQLLPQSICVFKRSLSLTNHHPSLFWLGSELLSSPQWSMLCYLRFTALSVAPSTAEAQKIHHGRIVNSPNLSFAMEWNPGICSTNIQIRCNNDSISIFWLLEK